MNHYSIEFPDNIKEILGPNGTLEVHLNYQTFTAGGRSEETYFSGLHEELGSTGLYVLYNQYNHMLSWADAEAYCVAEGGHLASVESQEEMLEISRLARGQKDLWLGGTDSDSEGNWTWTNGAPWEYTNWQLGFGAKGPGQNCLIRTSLEVLKDTSCKSWNKKKFICKLKAKKLTKTSNIFKTYKENDIQNKKFQVWHKSQTVVEVAPNKTPGFEMKWVLRNIDKKEPANNKKKMTNEYDTLNLKEIRKIMHLVNHVRWRNLTEKTVFSACTPRSCATC